jgi:hypothetical protein
VSELPKINSSINSVPITRVGRHSSPRNTERPDDCFTNWNAKPCHIDERSRKKRRSELLYHAVRESGKIRQTAVTVNSYIQAQRHSRETVSKSCIESRFVVAPNFHAIF